MDKIKVNNQIILMRKYVKQAKIRAINKLVKEVKLLQNRKGNEDQVQKANRKAERYLKELEIMKKMKPDFVSKQALSKVKDWKDILIQKTSTIEERSLALLASYDSVQKEVEKFYLSNPNLVSKIPDLINQWEMNKVTKKANSKKGENTNFLSHASDKKMVAENIDSVNEDQETKTAGTESHSLTLDENKTANLSISLEEKENQNKKNDVNVNYSENFQSDSESVTDDDVSRVNENDYLENIRSDSDDANNNSESETCEMTKGIDENLLNNKNSKDNSFEKMVSKHLSKPENSSKEFYEKPLVQNSKPNKLDKIPIDSQKNDLKTIAVFNLEELVGLDEIPIENKIEDATIEEDSDIESSEKSSDPFFLKPGESPPVDTRKQLNPEKKTAGFVQQGGRKMNRYERRHGQPKFQSKSHQFKSAENSTDRKSFNKAGTFQPRNRKESNFNSETKKQFPSKGRNNFKSKGEDNFKTFNRHVDKPNKPSSKRKETAFPVDKISHIKEKTTPEKPLHPSWEAKRKLKEVAHLPFQGKRTVFED